MRRAVRLLALLPACFGSACFSTLNVAVDRNEDFSGYATWDWLPDTSIGGEPGGAPPSVDALAAHHIERALIELGLPRSRDRADFFVDYAVAIRRRMARIQQPFAPRLVDSYSSSASYWVEGTDTVTRNWIDLELSIRISEGHGRTTWRGTLAREVEEGSRLPLESAAEDLVARFAEQRRGRRIKRRAASARWSRAGSRWCRRRSRTSWRRA